MWDVPKSLGERSAMPSAGTRFYIELDVYLKSAGRQQSCQLQGVSEGLGITS
jgi:hypothetical protein